MIDEELAATEHELEVGPIAVEAFGAVSPVTSDDDGGEPIQGPERLPPAYVYAIGRIEPRFPSIGIEKELQQAAARIDTKGLTEGQVFHAAISTPENRYLARQLCWVLTIEGLETYVLVPHDPGDLDLLVASVRPEGQRDDLDVVIGDRGPLAPPEMCNGLAVPLVAFDQLYSFDRETFIKAVPRPESLPARREAEFRATVGELFERLMLLADNAGATDEHRALNYLAVRYAAIYARTAEAHEANASLSGVSVLQSPLSGSRNIVEIVFSYTDRTSDVTDKWSVSVDVTEKFPFLVRKLTPYYDR